MVKKLNRWFELNWGWFFINGRKQEQWNEYLKNKYKEDYLIFFNSGDRKGSNLVTSESDVCKEIGIEESILELPKIYSSSELLKKL